MLIDRVFTVDECSQLVNEFDLVENKNVEDNDFYFNSLGFYNLPGTLEHVDRLTQLVHTQYTNIVFSNTYTRVYQDNSILGIHTDRPGLDLTISICLENNQIHWPLQVSNIEYSGVWQTGGDYSKWAQDYTSYSTEIGQGALCQGVKYPHWRDRFPGDAGQRAVYTFYHWTII